MSIEKKEDRGYVEGEYERYEDAYINSELENISMVQDDMKAFIFTANFDNDFQGDYFDEF